ncbi:MAG TPA: beta-galactosidase, partial [Lacunisphaera sp.]
RWAEAGQKTAAAPAKLALSADRATLRADGTDLSFVTVSVRDGADVLVPRADNALRFTLEGPGDIVATDNGNPTSFEPFTAASRRTFNGLALVIVRTRAGEAGQLVLRAESDGLVPATLSLESR